MPKLVSIAVDTYGPGQYYIGVDEDGLVWRGELKRTQEERVLFWERIHSEFPRGAKG